MPPTLQVLSGPFLYQAQLNNKIIEEQLKSLKQEGMLKKVNGTKHLESTGEVYTENAFNEYFDEITVAIAKQTKMEELSYEEIVACRAVTQTSMAVSVAAGVGAGIALGQSIIGGIAIGVGTALVVDVVTPQKKFYNRVIKSLNK